jgi:hypothetical protein
VAIVVKVADLAGEVVKKVLTEHYAGGKPVADAGLGLAARRIDASVAVNPVADCAADFGVLRKAASGEQRSSNQAFQTHNQE